MYFTNVVLYNLYINIDQDQIRKYNLARKQISMDLYSLRRPNL